MNQNVKKIYEYALGAGNYKHLNSLYIHNSIARMLRSLEIDMYNAQHLRIIPDTTYEDGRYPWKHIQ